MRLLAPIIAVAALSATGAFAQSAAPAPAPAPAHATGQAPASAAPTASATAKLSIETTPMEDLLANPKAMEVLYKHFPEMKGQEDQLAMAGSMTLRDVQGFAAETFTDEKLAAVEEDFKALSAN